MRLSRLKMLCYMTPVKGNRASDAEEVSIPLNWASLFGDKLDWFDRWQFEGYARERVRRIPWPNWL
jgi:hypothetical protein